MKAASVLLAVALVAVATATTVLPIAPLAEAGRIDPDLARLLLVELRLPRAILALGYGATLGLAGAALQALYANPLASPDVTGGSSGAALGAVVGAYWLGASSPLLLVACGALGAVGALALVFGLAGKRAAPATLLLAGIAVSLAAGALTSLALALAPSPFAFYDSFDWLMGSFADRSPAQVAAALVPAAAAAAVIVRHRRGLDLLALGEEPASALGYSPRRMTVEIVAASGIAVGACVAVGGAVGFVGLVAPFLARRMTRGLPGRALGPAAAIGALLLALADLASRSLALDRPLPVGVVTALIGTPLFVVLVLKGRSAVTS